MIRSLEQGTFGSDELNSLYSAIQRPFRATFVHMAALLVRLGGGRFYRDPEITDPIYRCVMSLVVDHVYVPRGFTPLDLCDLEQAEIEHLGTRNGALIGLVHRLVQDCGVDELLRQSLEMRQIIDEAIADGTGGWMLLYYQADSDAEVERYFRLIAPINRRHAFALLELLRPSGELVISD